MDFDYVRSGASDVRTHCVEEVCKVNDMRFFCGVFDDCKPSRLNCGEHDIDCCADGNLVHINKATGEMVGIGVDHCVFNNGSRCAEKFKTFDVKVNRSGTNITATR